MSLVAHLRMISLAFLIVAIVGSTSASPAWAQRIAPAGVSLLRADAASASPLAPTSFAPQRSRPWWRYPVIGANVNTVRGSGTARQDPGWAPVRPWRVSPLAGMKAST